MYSGSAECICGDGVGLQANQSDDSGGTSGTLSSDAEKDEVVIKAASASEDTEADDRTSSHRTIFVPISTHEAKGLAVAQGKAPVRRGILVGAMVRS